MATNYVTSNTLDSGSKFPILTFSSRKKERLKPKFFPDAVQGGAICWQVSVDDYSGGSGSVRQTDSLLGISADSLVLVEESTKECIWAVSTKAILGWTSSTSSIKLYYHQGERRDVKFFFSSVYFFESSVVCNAFLIGRRQASASRFKGGTARRTRSRRSWPGCTPSRPAVALANCRSGGTPSASSASTCSP